MVKSVFGILSTAVLVVLSAVPASALDLERAIKNVTGVRNIGELGVPMLIGVAVLAALFFWSFGRWGKWRQKRMINDYHAELDSFSQSLRRGKRR